MSSFFGLKGAKASSYTKSTVACARSFKHLGAFSSFGIKSIGLQEISS